MTALGLRFGLLFGPNLNSGGVLDCIVCIVIGLNLYFLYPLRFILFCIKFEIGFLTPGLEVEAWLCGFLALGLEVEARLGGVGGTTLVFRWF